MYIPGKSPAQQLRLLEQLLEVKMKVLCVLSRRDVLVLDVADEAGEVLQHC